MNRDRPDRVGQIFAALGKSVCYLALFLGMQMVVLLPLIVSGVIELLAEGSVVDESALYALMDADMMALTLLSGLLTLIMILAFYLIRRKKLQEALMRRPVPVPTLLTGVSLAPGLYFVVSVVLLLLPEAWTDSYSEASAGIDTGTLVGVLSVAVVAPVVEEFIFRGLIMNRLSRVMPGWLAVVLSAAVFGACHGHPVWFTYAFVLGAVFGFIDLRAGSIWPSILGHAAFNAFGQVTAFLPETEEGTEFVVFLGVLLVAGILGVLLNRRAIGALFRPASKPAPAEEPMRPGTYDYDPWEE